MTSEATENPGAVGSPVDCPVRPLRDLTREAWADPDKMPHLVHAIVRAEIEATLRTAMKAVIAVLAVYTLVECIKLWAAA